MDFGITIESGQIIIGKPAHNHEPATHKRSFEEMESTDDNLSTDESSDDGETTSDEDYTSSDEETVTPIAKRTKSKSKKQKINGNSGRQVTIDIKHIFANGTSIHRCVQANTKFTPLFDVIKAGYTHVGFVDDLDMFDIDKKPAVYLTSYAGKFHLSDTTGEQQWRKFMGLIGQKKVSRFAMHLVWPDVSQKQKQHDEEEEEETNFDCVITKILQAFKDKDVNSVKQLTLEATKTIPGDVIYQCLCAYVIILRCASQEYDDVIDVLFGNDPIFQQCISVTING